MEILESQLSAYGKSMTEDRLRDETQRLMGEKEEYQEVAKKTLKRLSDEKLEAVRRQKDLEKDLAAAEQELAVLREMYERDSAEGQRLAEQVVKLAQELEEVKKKVPPEEEEKKAEEEGEDAASKNAQTDSSGGSWVNRMTSGWLLRAKTNSASPTVKARWRRRGPPVASQRRRARKS